jgi:hypothetical protein
METHVTVMVQLQIFSTRVLDEGPGRFISGDKTPGTHRMSPRVGLGPVGQQSICASTGNSTPICVTCHRTIIGSEFHQDPLGGLRAETGGRTEAREHARYFSVCMKHVQCLMFPQYWHIACSWTACVLHSCHCCTCLCADGCGCLQFNVCSLLQPGPDDA